MTEPTPPRAGDPLTAVLVAIAELRGEIRSGLAEIKRHSDEIGQLFTGFNSLRDRVTALEARDQADDSNRQRTVSIWSVAWGAVAAVAAVAAVLQAIH